MKAILWWESGWRCLLLDTAYVRDEVGRQRASLLQSQRPIRSAGVSLRGVLLARSSPRKDAAAV